MSLTIKSEGDFEALAVGQYDGVCYRIVDMGTREEVYKDNPPKKRTTVQITFELPNEKMDDGRPLSISRTYTQSLFESSALRKDLVSWRGKNFRYYLEGTAIKYLHRFKYKDKEIEDLEKHQWYVSKLIQELKDLDNQMIEEVRNFIE